MRDLECLKLMWRATAVRKYLKCQIILQACENQVRDVAGYFSGVWRC